MAIIRCPKGHNYDSTLYRKCPICETEAAYNLSAAYDKTFKLKDVEDEPTRKLCGADDPARITALETTTGTHTTQISELTTSLSGLQNGWRPTQWWAGSCV